MAAAAARFQVQARIISTKGLKNVNWRNGELKAYATMSVEPTAKLSTYVDDVGCTSPSWKDHPFSISFSTPIEQSTLHIDISHHDPAENTKPEVGSARIDLNQLVREVGYGNRTKRTLPVIRPSGYPHGGWIEITVGVRKLGRAEEDFAAADDPGVEIME